MKKGGGSKFTIIIGPSKSVLVYALHSLEYILGLARFRVFVPKLYYIIIIIFGKIFVFKVFGRSLIPNSVTQLTNNLPIMGNYQKLYLAVAESMIS